ncbi:MAG: glycosyltransferase, partial [Oscillospiraceae bacterium]
MKISKPEYADQILELINTMRECAKTMCSHYENNQFEEFYLLHSSLCGAMASITSIIASSDFFDKSQMEKISCTLTNIVFTLELIKKYSLARSRRTFLCTKYQLLPLLQDFYIIFHYYTCIANFTEAQEEYYAKTLPEIGSNEFINESLKTNEFPFELSIAVIGYNKLEYTKKCINSILENVPKDLNYELITINHGSSDETQSYFESLGNDKILNLKQNGCNVLSVNLMLEGRYVLSISNDVILGANAIENMLKTIKSDPKIYYVVPSTPNISNMQAIPSNYSSVDDFKKFTLENNIYDENRHEERTRLCNPVAMIRSRIYSREMPGIIDTYFDTYSFPDDTNALLLRRNGHKLVLAKDAYCHHFGSVTINDSKLHPLPDYTAGRINFIKHFGCDPWGFGFCFIPQVMEKINLTASSDISVLGVNMGFGSDPLQIKNIIKEKTSGTVT